jgi:dsDNA-specific endonuclease/ATPase MutS2
MTGEPGDALDCDVRETQNAQSTDHAHLSLTLSIKNGRHPTVEAGLRNSAGSRNFVPNSLLLSPDKHLHIITGPNMGGKSTVLRQTAIITILAQAGSFVPADAAEIGVVDAVFSRVGARDDLYMDRSTFMVEMHECVRVGVREAKVGFRLADVRLICLDFDVVQDGLHPSSCFSTIPRHHG